MMIQTRYVQTNKYPRRQQQLLMKDDSFTLKYSRPGQSFSRNSTNASVFLT